MPRQTLAERFGNANGNAPPIADSECPQSPQGEFQPGRYVAPPVPSVPALDQSPAWAACHADYESICRQLTAAQSKRDAASTRLRDIERTLSSREPNAAAVAQIANAAVDVATLQESIGALDRSIQLLERGRRLGETTLRDLSHGESARLRAPFIELHRREAQKVVELFTAALVAFDDFWRWAESWPGVGSGMDCERPCPDNSFGLSVRVLFERAGRPWQSAQDWSNHR